MIIRIFWELSRWPTFQFDGFPSDHCGFVHNNLKKVRKEKKRDIKIYFRHKYTHMLCEWKKINEFKKFSRIQDIHLVHARRIFETNSTQLTILHLLLLRKRQQIAQRSQSEERRGKGKKFLRKRKTERKKTFSWVNEMNDCVFIKWNLSRERERLLYDF